MYTGCRVVHLCDADVQYLMDGGRLVSASIFTYLELQQQKGMAGR